MAAKPKELWIYSYQMGFGDCFLLKFKYARSERCVLIDFGSFRKPEGAKRGWMTGIANQIKKDCGGKLHVVVATHRHSDHISGFRTTANGTGSGDIIASLKPDRILLPWTEHPKVKTQAKSAPAKAALQGFWDQLNDMQAVAQLAVEQEALLRGADAKTLKQLTYLGKNNLKNKNSVENLMTMGKGKRARYLRYNRSPALNKLLPGVSVRTLGPPDLVQTNTIQKQRKRDDEEFWHLQAAASTHLAKPRAKELFPRAKKGRTAPDTRWFQRQMKTARADTLLQIVRRLDRQMNNTSLILLFEVNKKGFLFPGDAQYENWMYALGKASVRKRLARVQVYKVGHHGSLNATPRSMWELFKNKKSVAGSKKMFSLMSTLEGVHGKVENKSEVPRSTLVTELKKETKYRTTETLSEGTRRITKIDLR